MGVDANLPEARTEVIAREPDFGLGTVTGIGSLPHRDPADAVAFVLDRTADLPAAPSLPSFDARQGIVAEGVWGIHGVSVAEDGTVRPAGRRCDRARRRRRRPGRGAAGCRSP